MVFFEPLQFPLNAFFIRDIAKQYNMNERRALSILAQQKHLRKRLKAAGVLQGKKVVFNDNV